MKTTRELVRVVRRVFDRGAFEAASKAANALEKQIMTRGA